MTTPFTEDDTQLAAQLIGYWRVFDRGGAPMCAFCYVTSNSDHDHLRHDIDCPVEIVNERERAQ